jgi:hypothetical protein
MEIVMKKLIVIPGFILLLFLVIPSALMADMARDYLSTPVGSWYPAYYMTFSETKSSTDGTKTDTITNLFRITRVIDVFGRTGGLNFLVPYVNMDFSSNQGRKYSKNGVGDPKFVFDMNIFGAPALNKEQFKSYIPQTYASFHLSITAPLGDYDRNNPINTGTNRWSIAPEVNYSYTPNTGKTWLEFYVKPTFFTNNNTYAGNNKLSQDPQLSLEGHASHNILDWLWVAFDLFYNYGGETRMDGVWQNNRDSTLSGGLSANFTPWYGGKILLNYKDAISAPAGSSQTRAFTLYIGQLF